MGCYAALEFQNRHSHPHLQGLATILLPPEPQVEAKQAPASKNVRFNGGKPTVSCCFTEGFFCLSIGAFRLATNPGFQYHPRRQT
jgi:hypothetical protein